MIRVTHTRERRVSLVVKLCDILTGETIIGSRDLTVISGDGLLNPVVKPDGYFVFTDRCPDSIIVKSGSYRSEEIPVEGHIGTVFRFSLIPMVVQVRCVTVPEGAYIGFGSRIYTLADTLEESSASIQLRKEDFRDITDMYHALTTPSGAAEAVYITKNLGGGRYSLYAPPKNTYPVRATRVAALHRTSGGLIPVPAGEDTVFIMSDGIITTQSFKGDL